MLHGISEVFPDSAPEWFKESEFGRLGSRFNLQFRDLREVGNRYIPTFNKEYAPV